MFELMRRINLSGGDNNAFLGKFANFPNTGDFKYSSSEIGKTFPPYQIETTPDEKTIIYRVGLPGFSKNDIDVEFDSGEGQLRISHVSKSTDKQNAFTENVPKSNNVLGNLRTDKFNAVYFSVPNNSVISFCTFTDGMLTITVNVRDTVTTKKIAIT